jgi:hypothetical protein
MLAGMYESRRVKMSWLVKIVKHTLWHLEGRAAPTDRLPHILWFGYRLGRQKGVNPLVCLHWTCVLVKLQYVNAYSGEILSGTFIDSSRLFGDLVAAGHPL